MPWQSLKLALWFNAVGTALLGLCLLAASAPLAGLFGAYPGAVPAAVMTGAGVVCLLFAADLAWVARRADAHPGLIRVLTLADAALVLALPVVMLFAAPRLSSWGQLLLADLALITAFLVWCQWRGLGGLPAAPASRR
ncbi:hypothetical protein Y5W_02485 [Alcanivorax sp. 521-1]|uniref:Sodium:proton antiporter n=1 Tax=Alloalcanivorax profundimaris TaxID=2735259 RepID=A0ABS0AST5_9GAMM|nr:hypothetical protein [Alloalcanivorax profundimaris]MBF5057191.1 hypothetical protein [Alloalcanivorax profundimaris]